MRLQKYKKNRTLYDNHHDTLFKVIIYLMAPCMPKYVANGRF